MSETNLAVCPRLLTVGLQQFLSALVQRVMSEKSMFLAMEFKFQQFLYLLVQRVMSEKSMFLAMEFK